MAKNNFGRKRLYPQHEDKGAFVPEFNHAPKVIGEIDEGGSPMVREWVSNHRDNLLPPERMFYEQSPAGFNDPRCLYLILDALVKASPRMYIRPAHLARWLGSAVPQYYWDANVVGRMLAGVFSAAEVTYGEGAVDEATLELAKPYEEDDKMYPFQQGRDTYSRYYVIDPKGGNEGLLWLMACRRKMFDIATLQQRADAIGQHGAYYGKGNAATEWYSDVSSGGVLLGCGPIRTKDAYLAQAQGVTIEETKDELHVVPGDAFSNTQRVIGRG